MTRRPDIGERAARAMADPWVLLASGLGGGLAWAAGIVPAVAAGGIGLGMVVAAGAAAAGVAALTERDEAEEPELQLMPGTVQARLVDTLKGYLGDLATLRASRLPDTITDSAIEALVATGGAHISAMRTAVAVDRLDAALARSQAVASQSGPAGAPPGVRESIGRMGERRDALLGRLDAAVAEVAEVYTKLLELSATVDAPLDAEGAQVSEVETVNASLDALRASFAELERDAAGPAVP
jgi:hypothetical protein